MLTVGNDLIAAAFPLTDRGAAHEFIKELLPGEEEVVIAVVGGEEHRTSDPREAHQLIERLVKEAS